MQTRTPRPAPPKSIIRESGKRPITSGKEPGKRLDGRFLGLLARCALTFLLTLTLADCLVRATFPTLARLGANFSPAYLERIVQSIGYNRRLAVLGDSVLWGYRLSAEQSAASLLQSQGVPLINLSFEGGSPANTYALLRLMENHGVRPKAVLFNVNLKVFNRADSAYNTLYPSVERSAWNLLSPKQRALLHAEQSTTFDAQVDAILSRTWALYGLRNDVREYLFGEVDAVNALKNTVNRLSGESARAQAMHVPTPEKFLGTYDLSMLADDNVELRFLRETVALLARDRIAATAILTPTNHALLHDYIDAPEYQAQLRTLTRILQRGGVRVLNYDAAFPARDFLDNDHLTVQGNQIFAGILKRDALR